METKADSNNERDNYQDTLDKMAEDQVDLLRMMRVIKDTAEGMGIDYKRLVGSMIAVAMEYYEANKDAFDDKTQAQD